ncbi:MAG TPA: hypothetical protein VFV35_07520 [Acidimicrobiales bacterium]|nr:hypothetical protein [Acidimicrobiales bacterium]
MFVQVITGRTTDPEGLWGQLLRWRAELRPGAAGFEGSTAGVAADGRVVIVARFADAASAEANSSRPEQGDWWNETARYFEGAPTFRESTDAVSLLGGGSDRAGFVQVMEGTVKDRARAEALETSEMMDQLRAARPDLLGIHRVWFADGGYVEVAYFTSEEEARRGEASPEFGAPQQEYLDAFGPQSFVDLPEPLLA